MNRRELKQYLEDRAVFHGFTQVAIAKAEPMDEEARRLENWLNQKHQGNMDLSSIHEKEVGKAIQGFGIESWSN